MKRVMGAVAALVGIGCGEPDDQAKEWVEDGAILLDVRTVGEHQSGHVEGSLNIPVQELEGRIPELDADRKVVVYCRSGGRSASAARLLRARGFEVHDMGPMSAWPD